jgi:hypothetical protein
MLMKHESSGATVGKLLKGFRSTKEQSRGSRGSGDRRLATVPSLDTTAEHWYNRIKC